MCLHCSTIFWWKTWLKSGFREALDCDKCDTMMNRADTKTQKGILGGKKEEMGPQKTALMFEDIPACTLSSYDFTGFLNLNSLFFSKTCELCF